MSLTKLPPFKHQTEVIELSKDKPYYAYFMEQGTGKTLVAIAVATHLFRKGEISGVIVLAPNGVHDMWVNDELPKHCVLEPDVELLAGAWHGTMSKKKMNAWEYRANLVDPTKLVVLSANIEAMRTQRFRKSISKFVNSRGKKWMLIIDESTVVKNHKADQSREVYKLAREAGYVRLMTGTPITQSPLDLFSQCKILNPDCLPYTSWTAFKMEFANEITERFGHRSFQKIISYKNTDKLANIVSAFSYRVLKSECLDLPPKIYTTLTVELTPEQRKLYKDLSETCIAKLDSKEEEITVTTVITMILRLHQIVLGYVQTDNGVMIPISQNRIAPLVDLLTANQSKAIIFCRFKADVELVTTALDLQVLKLDGRYVMRYTGDESPDKRSAAVKNFQEDPRCRYFVATSAAARGLTLTAAEQVVYYSQNYSLETRLQSEDRAHRSGQTKSVVYTDIFCPGTIEEDIIEALQSKKDLASSVMDHEAMKRIFTLRD